MQNNQLNGIDQVRYAYDQIGNLTKEMGVSANKVMDWNVYGKLAQIAQTGTFTNYFYDATGNKIAEKDSKNLAKSYIRDASGNILAIYQSDTLQEMPIYGATRLGIYNGKGKFGKRILNNKTYEITNHLGNVITTFTDNKFTTAPTSETQYFAFGAVKAQVGLGYRYGFNGKEKATNLGADTYDFGARFLKDQRWWSPDPLASKYPSLSLYAFVANMPLSAIDPDGKDIIILFYAKYENPESEIFKAAALTRKKNIENSASYNPKKDQVFIIEYSDVSDIIGQIEKTVAQHSTQFGKTREVGIYSHAGWDGPTGEKYASKYRHQGLYSENQMSTEGWASIKFNWSENAFIGFYGCNTSNDSGEGSFARKMSKYRNFRNVEVAGQQTTSYGSLLPDVVATTPLRNLRKQTENFLKFLDINDSSPIPDIGYFVNDTYMVASKSRKTTEKAMWFIALVKRGFPEGAPMKVFKNGIYQRSAYQDIGIKPLN